MNTHRERFGMLTFRALALRRSECRRANRSKRQLSKSFAVVITVSISHRSPIFKRDKYADLRLGVAGLYPEHKFSSVYVIFDFLAAHSIKLEKELADILQDKNVGSVTIEKAQKRNISFST